MKFFKKPLLLTLALVCALPIIAVYEANDLPTEEGSSELVTHGRGKRIYSLKSLNLTCNEQAPAEVSVNNDKYNLSKDTAEIAFDMDDVVLKLSKIGITWESIKKSPDAAKTIGRVAWDAIKYPFTKKRGKGLELADNLRELARSGSAGGAYAEALDRFKPGQGKVVYEIASNGKNVTPGMYKIILKLNQSGFTLRPATNQSTKEFELNKQRFPELLGLFDEGSTVNYTIRKGQSIIKKPDVSFFKEHIQKYKIKTPDNPHGNKLAIFIDDKEENVKAAAKLGMIAIHFVSPRKLIKDLQALGLPIPSAMNDYNESTVERMLK